MSTRAQVAIDSLHKNDRLIARDYQIVAVCLMLAGAVEGTKKQVHPQPATQHPTPNTQHPTPNTQHPTPSTKHQKQHTPKTKHKTLDTKPKITMQTPTARFAMMDGKPEDAEGVSSLLTGRTPGSSQTLHPKIVCPKHSTLNPEHSTVNLKT